MGVLDGKVAVITGGTRGLGLEIARQYAQQGAAVVVSSRTASAVKDAVDAFTAVGWQASGIACDVGDLAQVEALAAHAIEVFSKIDIWVNNAGISNPYGSTMHMTPHEFEAVVQTNILGTYYGSMVAMHHFLGKGSGKLINLLGRGEKSPAPKQNAYGSSKAWIRMFTLSLAKEYKDSGVGIYAFNPGMVDTDLLRRPSAVSGFEKQLGALKTIIPILANKPEVPAQKAVWLASSATDGKTSLQVRVMGRFGVMRAFAMAGWRRITKGSFEQAELDISTVDSVLES